MLNCHISVISVVIHGQWPLSWGWVGGERRSSGSVISGVTCPPCPQEEWAELKAAHDLLWSVL